MTPGWQEVCFAVAFGAFVLAIFAGWVGHRLVPVLLALGLASATLVALWNAASAA